MRALYTLLWSSRCRSCRCACGGAAAGSPDIASTSASASDAMTRPAGAGALGARGVGRRDPRRHAADRPAEARLPGGHDPPHAHDGDRTRNGARAVRRRVVQAWLPYDFPFAVRAFLRAFPPARRHAHRDGAVAQPDGGARGGVPMFLVNARLSARSAAGYARFGRLARRCSRSSPASPRRRPAMPRARGAGRAGAGGDRKYQVRSAVPAEARALGRNCGALRRGASGLARRLHPRRRGGAVLDALGPRSAGQPLT